MESKFYHEDFENSLKADADQFKMYPSKKIWHGIYNNVHPGRKWPSLAISFLFIFTLVIVGHLNTANPPRPLSDIRQINKSTATTSKHIDDQSQTTRIDRSHQIKQGNNRREASATESFNRSEPTNNPESGDARFPVTTQNSNEPAINKVPLNSTPTASGKETLNTVPEQTTTSLQKPDDNIFYRATNKQATNDQVTNDLLTKVPGKEITNLQNTASVSPVANDQITNDYLTRISGKEITSLQNTASVSPAAHDQITNDYLTTKISNEIAVANLGIPLLLSRNSIQLPLNAAIIKNITEENRRQSAIAAHNRSRKNKLSWTIFISPSLSYRTYSQLDKSAYLNTPFNSLAYINKNESAIERPSLGLQSGASVNYNITKNLKFTAGMGLSFLEFNKKAANVHPTIANLILINSVTRAPYTLSSFSNYGNRTGALEFNLHNYSFQGSIPMGFQYTLGVNDKMKLDLLSTFQPTYIILNQAYLLSSNNKNFISEPSLSRKWNMGISFGTLFSFRSDLYKWQIGPNVDYQLLSTYDSRYPVKEHLINYGVKLGMSKIRK